MMYYRTSDASLVDLTPEQFAGLAPVKQAVHRPYSVAPVPVLTATQRAEPGPVVITDRAATKSWTVIEKSQAEKDAEAEMAQSATDYAQAKVVFNDLRNGVGTAGERLTRIERVLARLLRDSLISRGL